MVLEEWFWSCIEVGFRLDDYRYLPKFANEIPSEEDEMRLQNETDMTSFLSSPTAQFNNSTTSNKKRSKEQKEQDRYVFRSGPRFYHGTGPVRTIHFVSPDKLTRIILRINTILTLGKLLGVTAEEIEQDRRNQEGLPPSIPLPKEDKKDTAKPVAAELFDTGSDVDFYGKLRQ